MTLRLNQMYKTATGYIIPRSHFGSDLTTEKSEKASKQFAIFEILKGGENHFVKKQVTMSRQEIRKALDLDGKEKIDIL